MPRLVFTLTDEMDTDLKAEAQRRGASIASLIRIYIAEGLSRDAGTNKDRYIVSVGGKRGSNEKENT